MTKDRQTPTVTAETERRAAEKRERLAAELRANLLRRKARHRERDAADRPPAKDGTPP